MPTMLCEEFLRDGASFSCTGYSDLVMLYITGGLRDRLVLLYDLSKKLWRRLPRCSLPEERMRDGLLDGISFEPRLDAVAWISLPRFTAAFINLSYVLLWPFATSDENRKRWDFLRASLGCCRSIFTPSIHGNLHKSATCTIFAICKNDKNRKWWVLIFAVYPSKCIALWPPQKIFACPAVTKTLSKRWIGPQKGRIVDNGHSLWGCGNWVASRDEIWWHFLHDAETLLSMQTLKVRTINVRSMIERQFSNVSLSRRDHGHLRWWNSERVQSAQKPMTNNRYPCSWPLMLEAMRCCSHLLLLVFIHSSHCRHVSNKMSGVLFAYQSVYSLIWDFLLSH